MPTPARVLIVDLNNFARYPTVAVGYMAAILRNAGMQVEIYSPLSTGVTGVVRERPARPWSIIDQRLRYWSAISRNRVVRHARRRLAALHAPKLARQSDAVAAQLRRRLTVGERVDAVLVSTYLMYHPLCQSIGAMCGELNIPLLVGGSYFAQPDVVREWIDIDGIAGIVGGEVEPHLPRIVNRLIAREPLNNIPGIWQKGADGELLGGPAPPLHDLDSLPFPDYRDFPWHRYPNRIVPIITGRGCSWGACTFCSDVTSSAGRTFRSRSPENVLAEVREQARRHDARLFVFVDLKLNSSVEMWRALIEGMQTAAPGSQWVAAVHVLARQENGLSADELKRAREAGLVRLTTGLESGSQRILRRMGKGTDLHVTSKFLRDATAAGISVRTTMIAGYPGEEADDVHRSARFLEEHYEFIDRVALNRFQLMTGTRIHRRLERRPEAYPGVTQLTVNHRVAQLDHLYVPTQTRAYRAAMTRLLNAAHHINRKELQPAAREFEGVM